VTWPTSTLLDGDKEFQNDVPELHLTFDSDPRVMKVVQLAAADEYRLNFSLTTIGSALRLNKGFELTLPSAHSDIGGGYAPKMAHYTRWIRFLFLKRVAGTVKDN
jgi:hypothetical protein